MGEGSGELLFDAAMADALRSKSKAELAEFVLMERIRPPVTPSLVVSSAKPGQRPEIQVRPSVGELGIFGVFLADGTAVSKNAAVGHLLRSKALQTQQGGV